MNNRREIKSVSRFCRTV